MYICLTASNFYQIDSHVYKGNNKWIRSNINNKLGDSELFLKTKYSELLNSQSKWFCLAQYGQLPNLKVSQGFKGTNNIRNLSKKDVDSTLQIYTVGYRCYRKSDFLQLLVYRRLDFIFQWTGPLASKEKQFKMYFGSFSMLKMYTYCHIISNTFVASFTLNFS